jgi:predicted nucleotidyltransferase
MRTSRAAARAAATDALSGVPAPALRRLRALLDRPGIAWVAVFGSRATRRNRPRSDLDVAVGVDERLSDDERFALRVELSAGLDFSALPADVVLADRASPALRYAVARDGVLVAARDPDEFVRFRYRAFRDYQDVAPLLAFHLAAVCRRIDEGVYGR